MPQPRSISNLIAALFAGALIVLSFSCAAQSENPAVTPAPRTQEYNWMSIATWKKMHKANVNRATKGNVDLLFLGDSITNGWTWGDNSKIFDAAFGQFRSANFAIGGDQTQEVLWRLRDGETGRLKPKLVVLMIGTNNLGTGQQQPQAVVEGVTAVVTEIQKDFPSSKILLLGLLPYGQYASSDSRIQVAAVNRGLAALNDDTSVFYYDFGPLFVDDRGNISALRMADFLHPTHLGFALLAEKLAPTVASLMKN